MKSLIFINEIFCILTVMSCIHRNKFVFMTLETWYSDKVVIRCPYMFHYESEYEMLLTWYFVLELSFTFCNLCLIIFNMLVDLTSVWHAYCAICLHLYSLLHFVDIILWYPSMLRTTALFFSSSLLLRSILLRTENIITIDPQNCKHENYNEFVS